LELSRLVPLFASREACSSRNPKSQAKEPVAIPSYRAQRLRTGGSSRRPASRFAGCRRLADTASEVTSRSGWKPRTLPLSGRSGESRFAQSAAAWKADTQKWGHAGRGWLDPARLGERKNALNSLATKDRRNGPSWSSDQPALYQCKALTARAMPRLGGGVTPAAFLGRVA